MVPQSAPCLRSRDTNSPRSCSLPQTSRRSRRQRLPPLQLSISREGTDDTLKNILTVPLSFSALLAGKLAVCGLLSLFLGIVSTVFTVTASSLLGFPGGDFPAVMQAGLQITFNCLFLYIAVLPIIAIAARIPNGDLGVILGAAGAGEKPCAKAGQTNEQDSNDAYYDFQFF